MGDFFQREVKHGRTCVYNVKYLHSVLNQEIEAYLKDLLQEIAEEKRFEAIMMVVGQQDHIQLSICICQSTAIVGLMKREAHQFIDERFTIDEMFFIISLFSLCFFSFLFPIVISLLIHQFIPDTVCFCVRDITNL